MAAIAIELLALIFLKVAIILLGALLYATGPITIGLVPTDSGATITRAWCSAVGMLLVLPVAWAAVFAVGALLINDAGTAGPLIAGNSDVGTLLGGVLLAVAGLASLWLCLRAAREASGLLRVQLGGMLALSRAPPRHDKHELLPPAAVGGAQSLRTFTRRVSEAGGAAAGALASSGQAGARLAHAGSMAAGVGRRGVLGTAGRRRASRRSPGGSRCGDADRPLARRGGRGTDGPRRHSQLAEQRAAHNPGRWQRGERRRERLRPRRLDRHADRGSRRGGGWSEPRGRGLRAPRGCLRRRPGADTGPPGGRRPARPRPGATHRS